MNKTKLNQDITRLIEDHDHSLYVASSPDRSKGSQWYLGSQIWESAKRYIDPKAQHAEDALVDVEIQSELSCRIYLFEKISVPGSWPEKGDLIAHYTYDFYDDHDVLDIVKLWIDTQKREVAIQLYAEKLHAEELACIEAYELDLFDVKEPINQHPVPYQGKYGLGDWTVEQLETATDVIKERIIHIISERSGYACGRCPLDVVERILVGLDKWVNIRYTFDDGTGAEFTCDDVTIDDLTLSITGCMYHGTFVIEVDCDRRVKNA